MAGRSRAVHSSQPGVHPRLEAVVKRHLARPWLAPLHAPTRAAFDALREEIGSRPSGLVLDSGCGTGESTRRLARLYPDCLVIGLDKSADRLGRGGIREWPHRERNAVWLRAELASFWRLALAAGWRLTYHYLLYPNPWPKPSQLQRRWYAHPAFPALLALGGQLEMRCNWRIYAEEFALATRLALGTDAKLRQLPESEALSPFERKYRASGHRVYSVSVSCEAGAV